jgi:hypothetical protein
MTRLFLATTAVSVMLLQAARGDEIRHLTFPEAVWGAWAPSTASCDAKDKSRVTVTKTGYITANGNCTVRWIVETAGSLGPNYAVHALCDGASEPARTGVANVIIRPENVDQVSIGRSFQDLKPYRRCPAR